MNEVRDSVKQVLSLKRELERKDITVALKKDILFNVDKLIKVMSKLNPSKNFSRDTIIEGAIEVFLQETTSLLQEEYDIDFESDEDFADAEIRAKKDYDLVILSTDNEEFEKTFLGECSCFSFNLTDDITDKIQYLAIFRAAPISGITHYAKIRYITKYQNTNKKTASFDGPPVQLEQAVELGSSCARTFLSPRYTKLSKLLAANVVSELF